MKYNLIAVVLMFVVLTLSVSCSSEDTQLVRSEVDRVQQVLDEQRVEAIQAGDGETLEYLDELQTQVDRAVHLLEQVTDESGAVTPESALPAVSAYLPPPWNLIALLGGPLIVGVVQELRKRRREGELVRDAESIVNGIDVVRTKDPSVRSSMKANKKDIEAQFTPEARRLVDRESIT